MSRIEVAKMHLQQRVPDLVRALFGNYAQERDRGHSTWHVLNPRRADKNVGSFVIWLGGQAPGAWKDYATGDKGDILDLIAFVNATNKSDALRWAEDFCGLRGLSDDERKKHNDAARARERRREKQIAEKAAEERSRGRKMFYACQENIRGTVVETYLAGRGIDLDAADYIPHTFRFNPAAEYWLDARRDKDGKKIVAGPTFPAMVSAMVNERGQICGCHLTFLAPDGSGKAPVKYPKLMWPSTQGLVVRVSRGDVNEDAGELSVLALTEGIEDALSIATARPDLRCWAAGSLSGYLFVPDHERVRGFLVFRDNDWDKPEAVALFERAERRLRAFGKPVQVLTVSKGKDVNELLNGDDDE
jgi:hypothetical protein